MYVCVSNSVLCNNEKDYVNYFLCGDLESTGSCYRSAEKGRKSKVRENGKNEIVEIKDYENNDDAKFSNASY